MQPKVAIDLTASLKDSDGDVENIEWQWARTPLVTPVTVQWTLALHLMPWVYGQTSTTPRWPPIPRREDERECSAPLPNTLTGGADGKTAIGMSANAVIENTDNRAPEFKDDQPSS